MADNGITKGDVTEGINGYLIVVFCSVAFYNVLELTFIIWGTFKRYWGIYFWSFMVATYGIGIYAVGFLLKAKAPSSGSYLYVTLIAVGWVAMVTGQSLVLWSRLHLILHDKLKLKLILYMIILNAFAMHIPIIVMIYGTNSDHPEHWVRPYTIYEKVQVTVFFIQEIIISSFYIIATIKLVQLQAAIQNYRKSRRLMYHLIAVNVIIIILDCIILGLEYANYYDIQTAFKALAYGIKLKMEFTILNRLKEMTTGRKESSGPRSHTETRSRGKKSAPGYEMDHFSGNEAGGPLPRQPGDISYSAYAVGGNAGRDEYDAQAKGDQTLGGFEVVKTTEIVVHREARSTSQDDSRDGKEDPFEEGPSQSNRSEAASKSSSELNLASRGF